MRLVSQRLAHSRDESGEPLVTIATRALGLRRGMKALSFMAAWDHARRSMRRESITLDEYADWWKESRASAYRHQAIFREAFPGESTPDRLLDMAEGQWVQRRGLSGLGQVRVSL